MELSEIPSDKRNRVFTNRSKQSAPQDRFGLYFPELTSTGYSLTGIAEELAEDYDISALSDEPSYSARDAQWRGFATLLSNLVRQEQAVIQNRQSSHNKHRMECSNGNGNNAFRETIDVCIRATSFSRWPRHWRENTLILIYNWCDEVMIPRATPDNELVSRLRLSDCFKLMFAGIMGTAQPLILTKIQ